jgi:hypothetical protein
MPMLTEIDSRCLELRLQIARARRRLDQRVRAVTEDVTQLLPTPLSRRGSSWAFWGGLMAAAVALSGWSNRPPLVDVWRRNMLGSVVAQGVQRLARHLRVLAWQARRRKRSERAEGSDERRS